jgi:hypothetical protein
LRRSPSFRRVSACAATLRSLEVRTSTSSPFFSNTRLRCGRRASCLLSFARVENARDVDVDTVARVKRSACISGDARARAPPRDKLVNKPAWPRDTHFSILSFPFCAVYRNNK